MSTHVADTSPGEGAAAWASGLTTTAGTSIALLSLLDNVLGSRVPT
jgi:hypothetical protein